jgi:FKBP-type peptidyl-prolyl cis-trans isomerase
MMIRRCITALLLLSLAAAQNPESKDPAKESSQEPKALHKASSKSPAEPPVPAKMEGKPTYTLSGTQYWDMTVGTGKKAISGFTVRVHYTGWYKKKNSYVLFDSSRGSEPIEFDLGRRAVIKGWDEGIAGMRVGGKRQLVIPPEAGYGAQGSGKIPSYTTLIFEVELVEVK